MVKLGRYRMEVERKGRGVGGWVGKKQDWVRMWVGAWVWMELG